MHLDRFEQTTDTRVLTRGRDLYDNHYLQQLYKIDDGEFTAVVLGTEVYDVYLRITKSGEIMTHTCTCPYDMGPMCKHRVAALYHIREHGLLTAPVDDHSTYARIQQHLADRDADYLRALILAAAKTDHNFRNTIADYLGLDYDEAEHY